MKSYGVELKSGAHITTTFGKTEKEARVRAFDCLDRPGRRDVLRKWEADDKPLRDKETNEVSTEGDRVSRVDELLAQETVTALALGDQVHVETTVRDFMTGNADMEYLVFVADQATGNYNFAQELAEAADEELWG